MQMPVRHPGDAPCFQRFWAAIAPDDDASSAFAGECHERFAGQVMQRQDAFLGAFAVNEDDVTGQVTPIQSGNLAGPEPAECCQGQDCPYVSAG